MHLLYDKNGASIYLETEEDANSLLALTPDAKVMRGDEELAHPLAARAPFSREDPRTPEQIQHGIDAARHKMMLRQLRPTLEHDNPARYPSGRVVKEPKIPTVERLEEVCAQYGMNPELYRSSVWNPMDYAPVEAAQ